MKVGRALPRVGLLFPSIAVALDPDLPLVGEAVAQQRRYECGKIVAALANFILYGSLDLKMPTTDCRAAIGNSRPIGIDVILIGVRQSWSATL